MNPLLDLYNLLLLNIELFYFPMHVWSLVVYVFFMLFTFLKLIKHINPFFSAGISFLIALICNNLYETIWWFMMDGYFRNTKYLPITSVFIIILVLANWKLKIFNFKKISIILLSIEILSFVVLSYTGHYIALRLWMPDRTAFDPHNWIWMINKALGVWYIYPSILGKYIPVIITKRTNKITKH